jgi:2-keto-4-pentenoate hydratase
MPAERIAELLFQAHEDGAQFQSREDHSPKDVDEAYRAQDLLYARLGKGTRPVAWKVGGPSDEVEPTIAPILPRRVLISPARAAAPDFHVIGIEAEIAFRFVLDLVLPCVEEGIARAIGDAVVAIELCDSRLADWKSAAPLWKLADNQMNWGLVVGTGTTHWREIDFKSQRAELSVGGAQRVDLIGAHPYGNPFRLMPWTLKHLLGRVGGVRAGDIVTTGSWGGLHFAAPGDEVVARFPGIGEAAVRISA